MAKREIKVDIMNVINEYVKEIKKHYKIDCIILFGSYAKGTESEYSDIDIAIVSEDFDEVSDFFIKEIIDTGIKVA